MIAAGLYGVEQGLELPTVRGQRVHRRARARAHHAARGRRALGEQPRRQGRFGDEVVAHYHNMARVELAAFDAAVTDWELRRSFERM